GRARASQADEVRVMRDCGVADKKGQRHQIIRPRTVSTRFGQPCVDAYLGLVTDGYDSESHTECQREVKGEVIGVISYTEELSKNVIRTGVPPPLPKYTKVAMWRGDDVCLNQLGAGDMEELLVGITWCEPKGSTAQIDLDLSVMV
ncbi:unnamed protein product, partial [Hapterophycus canaliculatus]